MLVVEEKLDAVSVAAEEDLGYSRQGVTYHLIVRYPCSPVQLSEVPQFGTYIYLSAQISDMYMYTHWCDT